MKKALLVLPGRIRLAANRFSDEHGQFLLLVALFLSLRLSLQVVSHPQGYLSDATDFDFYLDLGRLSDRGLYPFIHYWVEYPPLFPWLAVIVYRAIEWIPNLDGSPIFWFRMALGTVTLLFDLGNLVLLYWLGRVIHSPARGLQVAWIYAALFTPVHVWLSWFDVVPLFFLLLAVALGVRGRLGVGAFVAGLGFMVKVFPIVALPLLLKAAGTMARIRVVLVTLAALALVAAPFVAFSPRYLLASFQSMVARSPWETPWAIMEDYYSHGKIVPLEQRIDPSRATFVAYPSDLPWPAITVAFGVLFLLIWSHRFDVRKGQEAVALAGLTVNLFLLYSRGYSPQFLIYVVPFALLALPPTRATIYLIVLGFINLLEFPVYFRMLSDQHWVLSDLVTARTILLLVLSWEYAAILRVVPSVGPVQRAAPAMAALALALWGIVALPQAAAGWSAAALEKNPNRPLVEYLLTSTPPDSVVVFSDQGLYRDLHPYLHQNVHLQLIDVGWWDRAPSTGSTAAPADGWPDPGRQLARLMATYREILVVRHVDDTGGSQLEELLAVQGRFQASRRVGDLAVSQWKPAMLARDTR